MADENKFSLPEKPFPAKNDLKETRKLINRLKDYFREAEFLNLKYTSTTTFKYELQDLGIEDVSMFLEQVEKEGLAKGSQAHVIFSNLATRIEDTLSFVTYVGRNDLQLELLKVGLLEEVVNRNKEKKKIKIIIVGPASGEEMAFIFTKLFKIFQENESSWGVFSEWDIKITGIEINLRIIEEAKNNFKNGFTGSREFLENPDSLEELNRILAENRDLALKVLGLKQGNIIKKDVIRQLDDADIIFCNNVAVKLTDGGKDILREKFASLKDAIIFNDERFQRPDYSKGLLAGRNFSVENEPSNKD